MFSLAVGFSRRWRRWPAALEGVATSSSGPRLSPSDEEA